MKAAGCVVLAKKIGLKTKLAKTSGAKMEEKKDKTNSLRKLNSFIHLSHLD